MSAPTSIIAQLGCGYWGPNLLRAFAAEPACRVKWVAELRAERRAYVERHFPDCGTSEAWQEVVADPEVDGVVIATPAQAHFEMALEALRRDKHVLVEKPLALSVQRAEELAELARSRDLVLMAGHTFLYNEAVRTLRDVVAGGQLGDVLYVYAQRLNLGQVRSDVNAWWNLAPHDVSILLYLFDGRLPVSVAVRAAAYLQPEVEDVAFATLAWADGVLAHLHVSWLDPGKVRRVTVVGSRQMAVYDDIRDRKLAVHDRGVDRVPRVGERMDFDERDAWRPVHRSGDIVLPAVSGTEPLRVEARHFLDCLRSGAEPLSGPRHARDVVAVLEAGQESLRAGGATVPVRAGP